MRNSVCPVAKRVFLGAARGNALHELPEEFASDEFYQLRSRDSDCVNQSITVTSRLPPMLPIRTRHQNADRGQSRFGRGRYRWAGSNIEGMADESPAIEFDSVVEFKNALIGLVNRAACACSRPGFCCNCSFLKQTRHLPGPDHAPG